MLSGSAVPVLLGGIFDILVHSGIATLFWLFFPIGRVECRLGKMVLLAHPPSFSSGFVIFLPSCYSGGIVVYTLLQSNLEIFQTKLSSAASCSSWSPYCLLYNILFDLVG